MVAKSYQSCAQIGNPYSKNNRMYIQVQTANGMREVRWYTDKEYEKMYNVKLNKIDDARGRFGFFSDDNLYIARGTAEALDTFFTKETKHFGRFCAAWGWYIGTWAKSYDKDTLRAYKSRMQELNIRFYKLPYSAISDKNGSILPWEEINGRI